MFRFSTLAACCLIVAVSVPAQAQGLLWNLPDDGTFVEFEGKKIDDKGNYKQEIFRTEGDVSLYWLRRMKISSVGKEDAEYNGNSQPCRWIEIKVQTGGESAEGVDTGSVGERIYLVLVPESAIRGTVADEDGLPVSYIPIVKGYRKTSDRELTAKPIQSNVLQIYPVVSLIRHYKTMERSDIDQTVQIGDRDFVARSMKGVLVQESLTRRFRHETTLMQSNDVPFGLAQWTVEIAEERKAGVEARDQFKPVSKVTLNMQAVRIGTDAKSELRGIIDQN
jgi:hypothetical protein